MATTYKSFHCTQVFCCLNVHPFILLCTIVFPYYESSLIVFSWWVFGDTLRQRLLLTSHSTVQNCAVVSMYIRSFFSAPLSSLIMNHLWLSSHDEYSETHSDKGYYLQVIPLYRSVLLSKCTSIHSSLHRCLPLLWIISDCVLIMSIQRNMKTPTSLLQVIQLYISKLLSKCTSIHSSLHPCLPLLWIISDCLLMMSIQSYMKTPTC